MLSSSMLELLAQSGEEEAAACLRHLQAALQFLRGGADRRRRLHICQRPLATLGDPCDRPQVRREQIRCRALLAELLLGAQRAAHVLDDERAGSVAAPRPLPAERPDLAAREPMAGQRRCQRRAFLRVGPRQGHQMFLRCVRDQLALAHVFLHRLGQRAHQRHPPAYPALALVESPRQLLARELESLLQFPQQPAFLQRAVRFSRAHHPLEQQRLCFRQLPSRRLNRVFAQPRKRTHPLVAIEQHVAVLLARGDHHRRRLLAHLRQRGEQRPLSRRALPPQRRVSQVQLMQLQFHARSLPRPRSGLSRHPGDVVGIPMRNPLLGPVSGLARAGPAVHRAPQESRRLAPRTGLAPGPREVGRAAGPRAKAPPAAAMPLAPGSAAPRSTRGSLPATPLASVCAASPGTPSTSTRAVDHLRADRYETTSGRCGRGAACPSPSHFTVNRPGLLGALTGSTWSLSREQTRVISGERRSVPHVDGFYAELMALGYTPLAAIMQLRLMAHVSRWLESHRRRLHELTPQQADQFLRARKRAGYVGWLTARALVPLLA